MFDEDRERRGKIDINRGLSQIICCKSLKHTKNRTELNKKLTNRYFIPYM